jgi:RHS repeat-associated protein
MDKQPPNSQKNRPSNGSGANTNSLPQLPGITLPKGGGAIKGIDEKFSVNAATGTMAFSIPLPVAEARGFVPALGLSYNSGSGNSPFGLGWDIGLASISRKTELALPTYNDGADADTFLLGTEELLPLLELANGQWLPQTADRTITGEGTYHVRFFRTRTEGDFLRIEQWKNLATGFTHWRTISPRNVTIIYGKSAQARIADPANPNRIFEWLIERSFDDRGHLVEYEYKKENSQGITTGYAHTKNRLAPDGTLLYTNTYLTRVYYGNRQSFTNRAAQGGYTGGFLFETAFDYGEYDDNKPWLGEVKEWNYRPDAFSNYRAGFEIRTTRLCRRVLLFHHIPDDGARKGYDGLVSSTEFGYNTNTHDTAGAWRAQRNNYDASQPRIFSLLTSITSTGYKKQPDAGYTFKGTPHVVFGYQSHAWDLSVKTIDAESLAQLPAGIQGGYVLTDLYGEGLSGILTEQEGSLYYKENLGNAQFGPARPLQRQPSFSGLSSGRLQFTDLEGDGRLQLASYGARPQGFFEAGSRGEWLTFEAFDHMPNIDWNDPSLRLVDLDGDGRPDLLVTENDAFAWYPSDGKKGFHMAQRAPIATNEEKGPVLLSSNAQQRIFMADMSGDGLADLVRIRNGEICYWPNLGYGRFGAKVNMDHAPLFDAADQYDADYILLADIDGSGIVDLVYTGGGKCRCWFNLSGNEWSNAAVEILLPPIDSASSITVADLMGNGTACFIWSSSLPGNAGRQVRYIDLMGGRKPHLLQHYENNMGKQVDFEFRPSTFFYLEDKRNNRPWITRLPFPVHCLARTIVRDLVRNTVFETSYTYHHGHYDHGTREFRGFGRVEQRDTETFSIFQRHDAGNVVEEEHHQPPVRTVSWYHTGALVGGKVLDQYENEYYHNAAIPELILPAPVMPTGINTVEYAEAVRALRGFTLRREVYADDGTDKAPIPYTTSRATAQLMLVQPKGSNRHACFLVCGGESVSYLYDRNSADPCISHSIVLETNGYGQTISSASITYPRIARPTGSNAVLDAVWNEQQKGHITIACSTYTNDINDRNLRPDDYRLRVPCESRSYELLGQAFATNSFFSRQQLLTSLQAAPEISFDNEGNGGAQKRLAGHSRSFFLKNDLSASLPEGITESLGLAYGSLQMAFTAGLVTRYYGTRVTEAMLQDAGYLRTVQNGKVSWWIPSPTAIYPADAATQFYMPIGARDTFGIQSNISYDAFRLNVVSATDAIGNTISAEIDYRIMAPVLSTDINGNRTAIDTDEMGNVVCTAVMGKEGAGEGDTLADPTMRFEYNLFNWTNARRPNYMHSLAREEHGAANPRWQESYTYSDGSGGVIMTKTQAPPAPGDPMNQLPGRTTGSPIRWIGNGRTVLNNKGNPIRQYQPYFSTTPDYETDPELVETGVSPILYYDPVGRNFRTDMPDGTFTRAEFDAWMSRSFDANDTVMDSDWYAALGSPDPSGPEPADPARRAAWLAAKHYNTPVIAHADNLGRPMYAISDYGNGKTTAVRTETDLLGRFARVFDQKDRLVSEGYVNMLGATIYSRSAEKGEYRVFTDVAGRLVRLWDNDQREFYLTYDALRRPVSSFIAEGGSTFLFNHILYGDQLPDAQARSLNLKGVPFRTYDQAGMMDLKQVDFKGMPMAVERRLAKEYKTIVEWNVLYGLNNLAAIDAAAAPLLEEENFIAAGTYDALGRPMRTVLPDGTVIRPTYNEANGLDKLEAQVRGRGEYRVFLAQQDHDAKGQRRFAEYGNGLITRYFYDPRTFRLQQLVTCKKGEDPATQSLQSLRYFFDPVGNITRMEDAAQQTRFFANSVVGPEQNFEYDAVYQLVQASGRELAGLSPQQPSSTDMRMLERLPHANDALAMCRYVENYEYDDAGNIVKMRHRSLANMTSNWVRLYQYAFDNDANDTTNRITATNAPDDQRGGISDHQYRYDLHGNMISMPHLQTLNWNFLDQLTNTDLGGGGMAYYTYSGQGERVRKVIERPGGKIIERIYIGLVEVYRVRNGNNPVHLERWTVHISDNTGRIAQVDTKTIDTDNTDPDNSLNTDVIRYQHANHIGSCILETDEEGALISYEEYHPYGTTAYRIANIPSGCSLKRYRFSGKEHDDETGFYYFGMRYYAAWLGRWTSSDPGGFIDGLNLYRYCSNNPVMLQDPDGRQGMGMKRVAGSEGDHLSANSSFEERSAFLERHGYAMNEPHPEQQTWVGTPETGDWYLSPEGTLQKIDPYAETIDVNAPASTDGATPAGDSGTKGAQEEEQGMQSSSAGGMTSQIAAVVEKFIWNYRWAGGLDGGSQRGFILQNMYNNELNLMRRDNVQGFDAETATHVLQIKSIDTINSSVEYFRRVAREATTAAWNTVRRNPTGTMAGKTPQAILVTPTDGAAGMAQEGVNTIQRIQNGRARKVPGAAMPETLHGLPGRYGAIGRGLTRLGTVVSAASLVYDLSQGDFSMAIGDTLGTAGGGFELYAMTHAGAMIGTVSVMTAGIALGGAGLVVTSAVSGYRAYKEHDRGGMVFSGIGVVAGGLMIAGALAAAPVVLAAGIIGGLAVGVFYLGRHLGWWDGR